MKKTIAVLAAGAMLYVFTGCGGGESSSGTAAAGGTQNEVYAQVVSIVGNELTVELGTYEAMAMPDLEGFEGGEMPDIADSGGGMPEGFGGGELPDMGDFGGELPEGFGGGKMPDMASFDGELPEGFAGGVPGGGDGEAPAFGGGAMGGGMGGTSGFTASGETLTLTVPVDTPVTVSGNDTVTTTFNKIAAENILCIRFETYDGVETVAAIEIVG